ncbi:ATPase [Rhexocercosporidium sp. MPI-PUGE-AT-0058]|nr:ATPase [Rhexocercosporidium sp. MPI-PUGE-AT-0058]
MHLSYISSLRTLQPISQPQTAAMAEDMSDLRGRLRQAHPPSTNTAPLPAPAATPLSLRNSANPPPPRRSRREPEIAPDSFRDVETRLPQRRPNARRERTSSVDSRQGSSVGSPGPRAGRFMPSRPMFDWHGPLCQLLKMSEDSSIDDISDALEDAAAKLELAESIAETMMPGNYMAMQGHLPPRWQVLNKITCYDSSEDDDEILYLGDPYMVERGPQLAHIVGSRAITNGLDLYLEKNKDVAFLVYRNFECCNNKSKRETNRSDKKPTLTPTDFFVSENVSIESDDLREALSEVCKDALGGIPGPLFVEDELIKAPFFWWYHRRSEIEEARRKLNGSKQELVSTLYEYIMQTLGQQWSEVDSLLAEGKMEARYIDFLFVPQTTIIVKDTSNIAQSEVFKVAGWLMNTSARGPLFSTEPGGGRTYNFTGYVEGHFWVFDGDFQRSSRPVNISKLPSPTGSFPINEMEIYPLRYADQTIRDTIRARGEMFWKCRRQNYVCYRNKSMDGIQNASDPRFMIDYATYKLMHPPDPKKVPDFPILEGLDPGLLGQDKAPLGDDFVLCLPNKIPGYNMQKKDWITLDVSRLAPVVWNTKAFDSLVVDDETKVLVSALVTNQIDSDRNTDIMSGKGNGLFILLHGGPGTGKTLTAESVAEFARKPLYRVTCGDIGTKAEEVEKYLEVVLLLGKIWGCVVLLDEADVFLEQRTLFDLQRNALVSVFLRVLEYYDGILILTSNRVGTFDEAFKSRIQLSLRYNNLDIGQRLLIWGNFITRLEGFQTNPSAKQFNAVPTENGGVDLGIKVEEIRAKLPELAKAELNGREIRNAVSTARQLAMFKGVPMGYEHLESVIEEAKKFNKYLLELQKGMTSDQKKNRQGER